MSKNWHIYWFIIILYSLISCDNQISFKQSSWACGEKASLPFIPIFRVIHGHEGTRRDIKYSYLKGAISQSLGPKYRNNEGTLLASISKVEECKVHLFFHFCSRNWKITTRLRKVNTVWTPYFTMLYAFKILFIWAGGVGGG